MEGAISSRPNTRIAVVTGGNKGIGFEVCRQLASDGGVTVVLTARDETRGAEAAEKLRALGVTDVVFHQLDITDASSIATLVDFLKTGFGKLDILVNNAGVGGVEYPKEIDTNDEKFAGLDSKQRLEWMVKNVREPIDAARKAVETNYHGTKHVTQALLPLLLQSSSEGKIVNVSSEYGLLRLISNEEVRRDLNDIDNLTEERLNELLDKFLDDFEADELEAHGVLGVQGSHGRHQRIHEDPGEEAPHAACQLRASGLRQDGYEHGLWCPDARGGSARRGEGGAAAGRWPDRQVLHQGRGGVVRVRCWLAVRARSGPSAVHCPV